MGRGGKGHRGRGGKNKGGRGGGPRRDDRDSRTSYDKIEKTNANLENYYNTILGLDDAEKEEFWAALKRELPNSFRFAGSKGHALAVQKLLKERYIPEIVKIEHYDGSKVEPPLPVPWYPDELAWWMTTPKNVIRRFPPFAAFQKYLVSETSVGNISRQEVVSMIPPLVLDVEPGMTVLDMCAAPGSKAAQLLEMVHKGEESRMHQALRKYAENGRETSPAVEKIEDADDLSKDPSDDGRATGLLIANDADYKRSHMLIHQLKRLSSPNLLVTNHDATMFPSIKLPPTPENPSKNRYLKFDRILADVPCSGDGTCRKNPVLWKDWNGGNALGLHATQVRILVRALQMLKAGGRVVYSTCSMNPVENEAVIAAAIERCGGLSKVQIIDSSDRLPLLKRKPGMKDWSIMDKQGNMWSSWSEVQKKIEEDGQKAAPARVVPSMFPPTGDVEIPLERCMRVYAHQQDTGGFFIVVLQKMSEFKAKPEGQPTEPKPTKTSTTENGTVGENSNVDAKENEIASAPETSAEDVASAEPASIEAAPVQTEDNTPSQKRPLEEDPEEALSKKPKMDEENDVVMTEPISEVATPAAETAPPVQDTKVSAPRAGGKQKGQPFEEPFKYISGTHPEVQSIETFYKLSPSFPRDRFMVRNAQGDPVKTIYYTSGLIRDILSENEGKGIKFIHGGVRMFMRQDVQGEGVCRWRIQAEGMPILQGYVGEERVVHLYKRETLRRLLVEMFPKVTDNGWQTLGEIGERVRDIGMGCCVLRIEPSADEDGFTERMVLPLWRSLHSLNLMLAKEDRSAMLLRLFNETTPLVNDRDPRTKDIPKENEAQNGEANGADAVGDAPDKIVPEPTPLQEIPAEIVAAEAAAKEAGDGEAPTEVPIPAEEPEPTEGQSIMKPVI